MNMMLTQHQKLFTEFPIIATYPQTARGEDELNLPEPTTVRRRHWRYLSNLLLASSTQTAPSPPPPPPETLWLSAAEKAPLAGGAAASAPSTYHSGGLQGSTALVPTSSRFPPVLHSMAAAAAAAANDRLQKKDLGEQLDRFLQNWSTQRRYLGGADMKAAAIRGIESFAEIIQEARVFSGILRQQRSYWTVRVPEPSYENIKGLCTHPALYKRGSGTGKGNFDRDQLVFRAQYYYGEAEVGDDDNKRLRRFDVVNA